MKGDLTMAQLSKALFSSTKEDWATPQDFFDKLDEEFHFDLDPCADAENAKCKEYFTKEENRSQPAFSPTWKATKPA